MPATLIGLTLLLYRLRRRLRLAPVAGLLAALLLAFAPSFCGDANVQRVYGLGALFVLLATDAACRCDERREPRHPRWRMDVTLGLSAAICPPARRSPARSTESARDPSLADTPAASAARHARLAELLEARGEVVAARGHRLRALTAS